jgi:DNA-binding response OmpR family regulator
LSPKTPNQSINILIVNANPRVGRVYEQFFKDAGLKVVARLTNAQDLTSFFTPNSNTVPDSSRNSDKVGRDHSVIILLDHELLETVRDCVRNLRESSPRLKVVLTLKRHSQLKIKEIDQDLIDDTILKPFTISELVAVISKLTSLTGTRGTVVLDDADEMSRLILEVLSDSQNRASICLSPFRINRLLTDTAYLRAREKGLQIQLITEITNDNINACKQLVLNRGVLLRHLKGVARNFSIYDEKHLVEDTVLSQGESDSTTAAQILYSNLESIVSRDRYLFDRLWAMSVSAEKRISELEEVKARETFEVALVSGKDKVMESRVRLIENAEGVVDICSSLDGSSKSLCPELRRAWKKATDKGVQTREITEVTKENISICKDLINIGIDLRHMNNVSGVFAINERELLVKIMSEEDHDKGLEYIHSNFPLIVEQHRSIFKNLWNLSIPASSRIRELEA